MTLRGTYPPSPSGRFKVIDAIPTQHPYTIGAKHVVHASDHFGGILGEEAILDCEKKGIKCDACKGRLSYEEHEWALLVDCTADPKEAQPEVKEWLQSLVAECEKNKYAGFAFKKSF